MPAVMIRDCQFSRTLMHQFSSSFDTALNHEIQGVPKNPKLLKLSTVCIKK